VAPVSSQALLLVEALAVEAFPLEVSAPPPVCRR
jgi:hypothetical protein